MAHFIETCITLDIPFNEEYDMAAEEAKRHADAHSHAIRQGEANIAGLHHHIEQLKKNGAAPEHMAKMENRMKSAQAAHARNHAVPPGGTHEEVHV